MKKNMRCKNTKVGRFGWLLMALGLVLVMMPAEAGAAVSSIDDVTLAEDTSTNISYSVSLSYTVATQEVSWVISDLLPANSISVVSTNITIKPASDQFDAAGQTITLRTKENPSSMSWDETSFDVIVTPVDDPASFTGYSDLGSVGSTTSSVALFDDLQIQDADADAAERYSATVSITAGDTYGSLDSYVAQTDVTAATLITELKKIKFKPNPFLMTGQENPFTVSLILTDANEYATGEMVTANTLTGFVNRVNVPPEAALSLVTSLINDTAGASDIFDADVYDFDADIYGSNVTVRLECTTDTQGIYGTLSNTNTFKGSITEAIAYLNSITYEPIPNQLLTDSKTISFKLTVTDDDGAIAASTADLLLKEVKNPPSLSNISTAMTYIKDSEFTNLFSTVLVADVDRRGLQPVSVELSVSPVGMGTFTPAPSAGTMTPDAAQTYLRTVKFKPDGSVVAVGATQTATVTVKVTDSTSLSVQNSNARVTVSGVNGPPEFTGGVPDTKVVSPSEPKPFKGLGVSDDDAGGIISGTITIDNGLKGTLTCSPISAGFTNVNSSTYSFSGTMLDLTTMFAAIKYDVSPTYSFASGAFGKATFTIQVEDTYGNRVTKTMVVVVSESARAIAVTSVEDTMEPGTLRHAVSIATAGDAILFDFDLYPQTIRLNHTLGPIEIDKHLKILGPGANNVTISGDSDGAQGADTQIFKVSATVSIEGVRLEGAGGTQTEMGGAINALENSVLTIRNCVFENCSANQYGGAINVDYGDLTVENSLFRHNATSDSGMGGGAISVYSAGAVALRNTTFSSNTNGATDGTGGGAVYLQISDSSVYLDVSVVHCTFKENVDHAGLASAVYAHSQGTRVFLQNSLFADQQKRNLYSSGGARMSSLGGNISDDSTSTPYGSSSEPNAIFYLNHSSDKRERTVALSPLAANNSSVDSYALTAGSVAIDAGTLSAGIGLDQRGRLRDSLPDCGAYEYEATRAVVLNEIQQATSNDFLEFYIPRDASTLNLAGYKLRVDGTLIYTFTAQDIEPGFGFVVAHASLTVPSGCALLVAPSLDLPESGLIELVDANDRVLLRQDYCAHFVDVNNPSGFIEYPNNSLTLSPQFVGSNFLPHSLVGAGTQSPGADTTATDFGASNASPVANEDAFVISEDFLMRLDVLANDADADGADAVFVAALPSLVSATGSELRIQTDPLTGYGIGVWYDPSSNGSLQQLTAADKVRDSFTYAVADYGEGVLESITSLNASSAEITSVNHRLVNGDEVLLVTATDSRTQTVSSVTANTFVLNESASELGSVDRWVSLTPRGGTSFNTVWVDIVGANDTPVAVADRVNTGEEQVLTLLTETEVLANETDVDTDDDAASLNVVGLVDRVHSVEAFSGQIGDTEVVVTSAGHGLSSGDTVVISGYAGYGRYNGLHTVSVIDTDRFEISVDYVDGVALSGVWGYFNEADRLTATSSMGASVQLDIRVNKTESTITYNPLVSSNINAMALGELADDRFYYAVEDSHGALALGEITVGLTGANEAPIVELDPQEVRVLESFVGAGETLRDVLDGLRVLDTVPSASAGRTDVRVLPDSADETDSVVLENMWETTEDEAFKIPFSEILANDYDEDTSDNVRLTISSASVSTLGITTEVDAANNQLIYRAADSALLNALAHNECLIDTFEVVINDTQGGLTTNWVALLVRGVNDAPVSYDDHPETKEDRVFTITPITYTNVIDGVTYSDVDYDVDHNGVDPDNSMWILETNGVTASHGLFSVSNGVFRFDPSDSRYFDGVAYQTSVFDRVTYTLTDQSFIFANDDLFRVEATGTDFSLPVLANDALLNERGGSLTITAVGRPDNNGTVQIEADGLSLTYTPDYNFVGDEIFTYAVNDEFGNYSQGRVTVRVTTETFNGRLQVNADHFTVAKGELAVLPVLLNDDTLPLAGADFSITSIRFVDCADGVTINGRNLIFEQTDTSRAFPYTAHLIYDVVADGTVHAQGDVFVQVVNRSNLLPVMADHYRVSANSTQNILNVIANDMIQPEPSAFTLKGVQVEGNGTVTLDTANNWLLYTPKPGFVGMDTFTYLTQDELGGTGVGTVTVRVGDPVVGEDVYTVPFNAAAPVELDVLSNDYVLLNPVTSMRVTEVTPTASSIGTVAVNPAGSALSFTANTGAEGSAVFSYTTEDEAGTRLTGRVTVAIAKVDDVYANADQFYVSAGAQKVEIDALANDLLKSSSASRVLTVFALGVGTEAPNHGGTVSLSGDAKTLVYSPAAGYVGEETFTYTVTDGYNYDDARVTIVVKGSTMGVADDVFAVYHDGPNSIEFSLPVLANDRFLPQGGGAMQVVGIGTAPSASGTVRVSAAGDALLYTPDTSYAGSLSYEETFTYEVSDGSARRALGSVKVLVLLRNEDHDLSREINDDRFSVVRNSTANQLPVLTNDGARPASASNWNITSVSTPVHGGQVTISGAKLIYTPKADFIGTDRFTYSISDRMGGTGSAEVAVKVGDIMLNSDHFTVISGTATNQLDVLANDEIMPRQAYDLQLHEAFASDHAGQVAVVDNKILFTPSTTYSNEYPYTDHFLYTVCDDSAICLTQRVAVVVVEQGSDRDQSTVVIKVHGVNDLPLMYGFSDRLETTDKTAVGPYSVVNVSDVDEWGNELLTTTIRLDDVNKGSFTNLGGFVESSTTNGLFVLQATPAQTTTALRGLVYVPTENRIPGGKSEVATFDLTLRDPFMATAHTKHLDLLVWAANDAPTVTGVLASQTTRVTDLHRLFVAAEVADVDEGGQQALRAELILNSARAGTLANLGGFILKSPNHWEMEGTAAQLTASLQAVGFRADEAWLDLDTGVSVGIQLSVRDAFVSGPVYKSISLTIGGPDPVLSAWATARFGSLTAMRADSDNDGRSNLQEYAFGSNPDTVNPEKNVTVVYDVAAGQVKVSYLRRAAEPALVYELWSTEDLSGWRLDNSSQVTSTPGNVSVEWISDEIERCTITLTTGDSSRFYRVKVSFEF